MRTALALIVVLAASGSGQLACSAKVDCDKLEARVHSCTKDLIFRLRPDQAQNYKKASDPEVRKANDQTLEKDVARTQKALDAKLIKKCKDHKGRAADAKQINKCLATDGCSAFANCFAGFLKEKSN